jgi:hypothetical protein
MRTSSNLPLVFTYDQALRHGYSRHQISRRVRNGTWYRWQRGVYAARGAADTLPPREQHLLRVAALLLARDDTVASHLSAAAAYGWPLPLAGAGEPTVTCPTGASPTRRRGGITMQVATLRPADTMTLCLDVGGERLTLRCTRPARTLADVLRHVAVADSVAIGDAALRGDPLLRDAVAHQLGQQVRWPYVERARTAFPLLDARRESWLESYSFVVLHQMGLPLPQPQVTVQDDAGRFVARVDGWLAEGHVALEVDGRAKYLPDLPDLAADAIDTDDFAGRVAAHVRDSLLRQNDRQRRLEDLGVTVVRWGLGDIVRRPDTVAAWISRAVRQGSAKKFVGRVEPCEPFATAG